MTISGPTLCLIDGSGYIFRAFYALPPMHRPDGTPTNAVYGFTSMMLNLLQENCCQQIVVVFDAKRENFRNKIYPEYKANRREIPPELIPQFPLIRAACDALNIDWIEQEGYEADDLIATYAHIAHQKGQPVRIISADKDLMQLMQEGVVLYDPMKKKELAPQDVIQKFGVPPDKVIEVQSLMGDSTDNVPGAGGIGPKTAANLIQQYNSIENLYQHLDEIKSEKQRQKLLEDKEKVFISKQLVTLDINVPVDGNTERFHQKSLDQTKVIAFLSENNFPSLVKKLNYTNPNTQSVSTLSPLQKVEINSATDLQKLQSHKQLAMDVITENNIPRDIYFATEKTLYHLAAPTQKADLFATQTSFTPEMIQVLKRVLSGPVLITYNAKNLMHQLDELDLTLSAPIEDIELAAYNLQGDKNLLLPTLVQKYLNIQGELDKNLITYYMPLFNELKKQLELTHLTSTYRDVDLPLLPILFQMEKRGILTDKNQLISLDKIFTEKIQELTQKIHALTGDDFNINSPTQLGNILFDKMGLTGGKRGPSGHWITDVRTLETLADNGNELSQLVLEYRGLAKLKSTYIDDLLKRSQTDTRIHTTYSLVNTNTGRLASSNPNLQNIPVRSEDGKNIRQAFIAKRGYTLISADYSQIELRLMADVAHVKKLQESFIQGEDIHARTASQILHIPLSQITPDQRRQAKAVNFGIIYGISGFGLARNLGISRNEANQYITDYFEQYPEIKDYMARTIDFVDSHGYVETPFGRRIYINGLNNNATRQFAHRSAINAPIQGGAADIIKMAMIRIQHVLKTTQMDISLLLQVHDELIFEVADAHLEKAKVLIKQNMEQVIKLSVPLIAEVGTGSNWREAH